MKWTHKKYKKLFSGSYEYVQNYSKSERVFVLTSGSRVISFESWQQAKKLGWTKV